LVSLDSLAHKFKMIEAKAGKIPSKPSVLDYNAYEKYMKAFSTFHGLKRYYLKGVIGNKIFAKDDPLRKLEP